MAKYELSLRDYWLILRKRRWIIFSVFISVLIITVIYTNLQKPIYQTSSSIKIIERKSFANLLTEIFVYVPGDPRTSAARVIKSHDVALRVAKELKLPHPHASEVEYENYASLIQASITTEEVEKTNILKIKVSSENPKVAALTANKVAEVFVAVNLKEKNKQARAVREFIKERLEECQSALARAEQKLATFRERENVEGIAIPLSNKLVELKTQKADLLLQYTELHPDVIRANEMIEFLQKQLANLPEKELEWVRLKRAVEINEKAYYELADRYREAQIVEAEKVSDVSIVDTAYPPSHPIRPNRPMNFLMGIILGAMIGIVSAFMVEQLDTSIGNIEDVEELLKLPVVGVIPHLEIEKEPRWRWRALENIFTKRHKHETKMPRLREQLVINYPPKSPIAEAYRICYTNISIEVLKGDVKNKIILLTSAGPGEGKSITATNLAMTIARMGKKTLLVDADLRRFVLYKIFELKEKKPGLTDILMGTASLEGSICSLPDFLLGLGWEETLKHPALENLNVLPAGSAVDNPSELLSSESLNSVFRQMRQNFDIVILDSPPVLAVTDPSIMGPKTDGVILVYEVGKIARAALLRAKIQLDSVKSNPKAVILNNISPDVKMYADYYYYYHYKYYGRDKSNESNED